MTQRTVLDKNLDSKTFRDFYYLKEELVDFCRKNALPTSGGKLEIADRIAYFLDTGKVLLSPSSKKKIIVIENICEEAKIEENFVCSEKHRAFFKFHIGINFSFNVAFQNWLKSHAGQTYKEAIKAYYQILEDKKIVKQKLINSLSTILISVIFLPIIKENLWKKLLNVGNIKSNCKDIIAMKNQILHR